MGKLKKGICFGGEDRPSGLLIEGWIPSLDCFSHEPAKRGILDWAENRYLKGLLSALRGRIGTSSECGGNSES